MAYNANIPQPNDVKSQSQDQILRNFQALSPVGNGFIQLAQQSVVPTVTGTNIALYQSPAGGISLKNAGGTIVDFTTKLGATDGWTRLASGILIQWGDTTFLPLGASAVITFPIAFTQGPWNVQVTPQANNSGTGGDPNSAYYAYAFTNANFKIWTTTRSGGSLSATNMAFWVAIGA